MKLAILFGICLFISVITLISFTGVLLEAAVNRKNANFNYSNVALIISCILWSTFYYCL